jgi:hypothetical protein
MQLILAHVSFAHADAVPLLTDVTRILEPGWSGLVGANGARDPRDPARAAAPSPAPAAGAHRRLRPSRRRNKGGTSEKRG